MPMTPTTCACRRRPTALANSGSTSAIARSHRRGATATVQDCRSGRTYANCKIHAPGTHIESFITWGDVDTYKVNFRKGDVEPGPAPTSRATRTSRVVPISTQSTTITVGSSQTTPDVHCTDYFTVGRTGTYVIHVQHHFAQRYLHPHPPRSDGSSWPENRAATR